VKGQVAFSFTFKFNTSKVFLQLLDRILLIHIA